MLKKVLESVLVVREDESGATKRVRPKIGSNFDFTESELADFARMRPDDKGGSRSVGKPEFDPEIVEDEAEDPQPKAKAPKAKADKLDDL